MSDTPEQESSARRVRSTVRRVALGATGCALIVYVLACVVADLVVVSHVDAATDARLAGRLAAVAAITPENGAPPELSAAPVTSGDLDDAPVVVWWVAPGASSARALEPGAPVLPRSALGVTAPTDLTVAHRDFRLASLDYHGGKLIAGTSAQESRSALSTLLAIEVVLAPVVLGTLYAAAWLIGRRAALPVEQARRRQLEFTADASHELRTPLSVIESEAGLALSAERPREAYRAALVRVVDESKRLRDIVDDLLWLARLDALPEEPPSEEVDLVSVAEVCAARFEAVAARRAITIEATSPGREVLVVAPADWLDRLVSVLIDNACRYADEGGRVEVAASLRRGRAVLTVDDDGPGIDEGEWENVFRRFHRASAVPGGAGLGLSIADAVVDSTGGEWEVGRAPIGGARIEVSWPAVPDWQPER